MLLLVLVACRLSLVNLDQSCVLLGIPAFPFCIRPCARSNMASLVTLNVVLGVSILLGTASPGSAAFHRRQYWPDPDAAIPTPEECIKTSLTNPTWGIYGPTLLVVNSSSDGTQGDVRFLTLNTATGISANCTAEDIELDPMGSEALSIWHNCSVPDLYFQFSLTSFEMRLKGTWSCGGPSRSASVPSLKN